MSMSNAKRVTAVALLAAGQVNNNVEAVKLQRGILGNLRNRWNNWRAQTAEPDDYTDQLDHNPEDAPSAIQIQPIQIPIPSGPSKKQLKKQKEARKAQRALQGEEERFLKAFPGRNNGQASNNFSNGVENQGTFRKIKELPDVKEESSELDFRAFIDMFENKTKLNVKEQVVQPPAQAQPVHRELAKWPIQEAQQREEREAVMQTANHLMANFTGLGPEHQKNLIRKYLQQAFLPYYQRSRQGLNEPSPQESTELVRQLDWISRFAHWNIIRVDQFVDVLLGLGLEEGKVAEVGNLLKNMQLNKEIKERIQLRFPRSEAWKSKNIAHQHNLRIQREELEKARVEENARETEASTWKSKNDYPQSKGSNAVSDVRGKRDLRKPKHKVTLRQEKGQQQGDKIDEMGDEISNGAENQASPGLVGFHSAKNRGEDEDDFPSSKAWTSPRLEGEASDEFLSAIEEEANDGRRFFFV
jgi:hypothetical protein